MRSVKRQTYEDWELIVVDDASNDNTQNVVSSFNDSRVQYVRHNVNRGGSAARNTGIRRAMGRYVLMLDDDDEIKPRHLKILNNKMNCLQEEWGVVYTGMEVEKNGKTQVSLPTYKGNIERDVLVDRCVGTTAVALIRKKVIKKAGLFDEKLDRHQDWDFYIRLSKITKFYPIKKATVIKYETGAPNKNSIRKSKMILKSKYSDKINSMSFLDRKKFESNSAIDMGKCNLRDGEYMSSAVSFIEAFLKYPLSLKSIIGAVCNHAKTQIQKAR